MINLTTSDSGFKFDQTFAHTLAQVLATVCGLGLVVFGAVTLNTQAMGAGAACVSAGALIGYSPNKI
jgi:hypothetical protein